MWFWLALACTLVGILLISVIFIRSYADKVDKSSLSSVISSLAIWVSLCTIFLLPLDVFSLSPGIAHAQHGHIQTIYYALYITLAAFAFLIMPFAYFFYEEDDGTGDIASQATRALKYTIGLLLVLVALIALGLVLHLGKIGPEDAIARADQIMAFVVGLMLVLGLIGWVSYTAYGIAFVPLQALGVSRTQQTRFTNESDDSESELLRLHAQIEYLQAKYITRPSSSWTKEDRLELVKLQHRESQLAMAQDNASTQAARQRSSQPSFITKLASWLFGLVALFASSIISVSLLLTTIDKAVNSTCQLSCGFQSNPTLPNPIDVLLVAASSLFPLDLVVFALLMVYLFAATLAGLVQLGVRILCLKFYDVQVRRTKPNALIMGVWFVVFFLLAINVQTLALAPQYASFGNQMTEDGEGGWRRCRLEDVSLVTGCNQSELARFNSDLFTRIPLLGNATFISNIFVLLVVFLTPMFTFCSKRRRELANLRDIENTDDLGEYLVS